MSKSVPKILILILIQITIIMIHIFRVGQLFNGHAYNLYYAYTSDLLLPFGAYFLLSINDAAMPFLQKWSVKAGIIFLLTLVAEICQFFGIKVLGATFDPFDIAMYAAGILIAAFVDVKLFPKFFGFWITTKNEQLEEDTL